MRGCGELSGSKRKPNSLSWAFCETDKFIAKVCKKKIKESLAPPSKGSERCGELPSKRIGVRSIVNLFQKPESTMISELTFRQVPLISTSSSPPVKPVGVSDTASANDGPQLLASV